MPLRALTRWVHAFIAFVLIVPLVAASAGTATAQSGQETWESDFGPITLTYPAMTGFWQQSSSQRGQIRGGSYDTATRTLRFSYFQDWNQASGDAEFRVDASGLRMTGTWSQRDPAGNTARGAWTATRSSPSVLIAVRTQPTQAPPTPAPQPTARPQPTAAPPTAVPVPTQPVRPPAGVATYRLIDVIWLDTGSGVQDGLTRLQWLQQPSAQGGRLSATADNSTNHVCRDEREQTFTLGWSFDRDISRITLGDSFRLMPATAKTTPPPACREPFMLASGDQNGSMLSSIRQVRDVGTGPGGFFRAEEMNAERFYAPPRPGTPAAVRFTTNDRDLPNRAFFHVQIESWWDVSINVLYLYEKETDVAPQPVVVPPAGQGDYRLIDVLWRDAGTGVKDGWNRLNWLEPPTARGGRIEVNVINPTSLMCPEKDQTFTLGWTFDRDISWVSFGQTFSLTPATSKSTANPACYSAFMLASGDQNGSMLSSIRQVQDLGTGPGGVFVAGPGNAERYHAPPQAGPPASVGFSVSDRDKPNRAFFHLQIESQFDVAINVLYLYERVFTPATTLPGQPGEPSQPPACGAWDVNGTWVVSQDPYQMTFVLQQDGSAITGTAVLAPAARAAGGYSGDTGSIEGVITGSLLDVVVLWPPKLDGSPSIGHYVGTVVANAIVDGTTSDDAVPGGPTAPWTATGPAVCVG